MNHSLEEEYFFCKHLSTFLAIAKISRGLCCHSFIVIGNNFLLMLSMIDIFTPSQNTARASLQVSTIDFLTSLVQQCLVSRECRVVGDLMDEGAWKMKTLWRL